MSPATCSFVAVYTGGTTSSDGWSTAARASSESATGRLEWETRLSRAVVVTSHGFQMNITLPVAVTSVLMQAAPLVATPPTPFPGGGPLPTAPSTASLLASAETPGRPVLALQDAERSAMEHQPTIRQAHYTTEAAIGQVVQARSPYLPQVIGTASWIYGNEATRGQISCTPVIAGGTTVASSGCPTTSRASAYVAQLSGTQLIYDFGQTTEKWKAADRTVESYKATETTTRNQTLYNLRSAFFSARADRALVRVQAETLKNEEKHLVQTEGFVRAGTQPEISLAQTRTDLANAKVALIQAENNYDIARAQLNQAMGVTASVDYDVADEGQKAVDGEDDAPESLIHRALAARPELKSLAKLHEADVLTIRSLRGGYAPTISGLGGLALFGSDVNNLTPTWEVGLELSWPILLGGLTKGEIDTAQGNLGTLDAQLEGERLQVRLDVEQARLSVRSAKVSIGATEEALINAREQLRLAEASYSQGVGNIIQLGDAQVAVTSAGAQRVQADFNLAIARAQLLLALGSP